MPETAVSAAPARADVRSQHLADVGRQFTHETANHQITVAHEDGLYRHLQFRSPEGSWSWFDLITWPGNLAIKGDHGGFLFRRQEDMFQFFRRGVVNPGYWAEKLPDGAPSVREYSEDVLKELVEDHLPAHGEVYPQLLVEYMKARADYQALSYMGRAAVVEPVEPLSVDDVRKLIVDYDDDGRLCHQEGARELLGVLESAGVVSDTWEWNLTDWDHHFLWCCYAIQWGINRYDALPTVLEPGSVARLLLDRVDVQAAAGPILGEYGKSVSPAVLRFALAEAALDVTEDELALLVELLPRVALVPNWSRIDEAALPVADDVLGASTSGDQFFEEN